MTIPPFGDFTVPADVLQALRNHPSDYRAGHIGPDAFPDVIAGQVTMHPGDGWPAEQWIRLLLESGQGNERVKSFAYGYAGHAAGDIFGHTYINLYAGDIFNLSDEQGVEVRHFALEGFIDKHLPPLVDHEGHIIDTSALSVDAPAVRDVLLLGGVSDYRGKPILGYLVAMADFRSVISDALEHASAVPLTLQPYLEPHLRIAEGLITRGQQLRDAWQGAQAERQRLQARLQQLPALIASAQQALSTAEATVANAVGDAARAHCVDLCDHAPAWRQECKDGCNAALNAAQLAVNQALGARNTLQAEQTAAQARIAQLASEVINAEAAYQAWLADQTLSQAQRSIDLLRKAIADANLLRVILQSWLNDIDRALAAYIEMSLDMGRELVKVSGGRPLEPLTRWLRCWAPVFQGLPANLPQAACAVEDLYVQLTAAYDAFLLSLGSARYLIDPVGQVTEDLKREYEAKVISLIKDEVQRGLVGILNGVGRHDLANVVDLLMTGSDAATLRAVFSTDETGKGLLLIRDVAERAAADMHLDSDGVLNPTDFVPVYNAVILAKLSLLDRAGLEDLAARAAVGSGSGYGEASPFNVLLGFLKSIDGDHQWQPRAPPYFRRDGWYPRHASDYPKYALGEGMPLWIGERKGKIFLQIFKGPTAEALEAPCQLGFRDLIDLRCPFRACRGNPFPDTSEGVGDACVPRLEVKGFSVAELATSGEIAFNALFPSTGEGNIADRYRYRVTVRAGSGAGRRRVLDRGAAPAECAGAVGGILKRVRIPYLRPGNYEVAISLTESGGLRSSSSSAASLMIPECRAMHKVRRGDTIAGIANRYGVEIQTLLARNRIRKANVIRRGRVLCIP